MEYLSTSKELQETNSTNFVMTCTTVVNVHEFKKVLEIVPYL
jgi:hypothetical protein